MSKIVWDKTGEKQYEAGVDHGVLYVMANGAYPKGVPWNGLTAVTESPSGAESTPLYADNIKYITLMSAEEFGGTIEAYMYPDEFMDCDGSATVADGVYLGQQDRKPFGMVYRTVMGNDTELNNHGYKLHLIYNAVASPSEKGYSTINDSPEAVTFSWEFTTTPHEVDGHKPTSVITIDSTKVDETKLKQLEAKLFGSESEEATLPLPNEVIAMFKTA